MNFVYFCCMGMDESWSNREFLLRNGVGKTCLWKKYILLCECIQKQRKKTMHDFKNSFFLNFLLIHRAKYIFSRDMFCLPHFWAKIHGVFKTSTSSPMASVASINNNLVESGFINLQHYSSPYICLYFHPVFLCAFILHNLPKCFINQNNPRSIISHNAATARIGLRWGTPK